MQQQFIQFHLNDQQPQSINAKRNLQEFSIQVERDEKIQSFQNKNQNTIELLMKNQKKYQKNMQIQNNAEDTIGWINNQTIVKNKSDHKIKKNRLPSGIKNVPFRETLKYKSWAQFNKNNQKRYSYDGSKNSHRNQTQKINLSFNNLIPFDAIQIARQMEIRQQICKRSKSQSQNRPSTANYYNYGGSKNIMTLLDHMNSPTMNCTISGETKRIHSIKQSEISKKRKSRPITYKIKNENGNHFLKTTAIKTNQSNNSLLSTQNKNIRRIDSVSNNKRRTTSSLNNIIQKQQQYEKNYLQTQIDIPKQNSNKPANNHQHRRNKSQSLQDHSQQSPLKQNSNRNQTQMWNKKGFNQEKPFRKNIYLKQKKHYLLDKRIRSHQLLRADEEGFRTNSIQGRNMMKDEKGYYTNGAFEQKKYQTISSKNEIEMRKQQQAILKSQKSANKNQNPNPNTFNSTGLNNFLQQDFSLLIKMLKNESQNVLSGHLHNYLTQMKNNSQYHNYYMNNMNSAKNTINKNKKKRVSQKRVEDGQQSGQEKKSSVRNQRNSQNRTGVNVNKKYGQRNSSRVNQSSILKNNTTTTHYQGFSSLKQNKKSSPQSRITSTIATYSNGPKNSNKQQISLI